MIFADSPYFPGNGGMSCRSGKVVRIDEGDGDKLAGLVLREVRETSGRIAATAY